MKAALDKITNRQEMQQAVAKLYQEQAAAGGTDAAGAAGPQPGAATGAADEGSSSDPDDNVVDAEVEDVEDGKK